MPVGFRLFYEKAGAPALKSTQDPGFRYDLQFDPAQSEMQLEAFVAYSPYNFSDYGHREAKSDFKQLTKMLGLKLNVDFELPFMTGRRGFRGASRADDKWGVLNGPAKDCKAPIVLLK
jgi:hypothetical protein